jgi:hypothetical protein
MDQRSIVPYLDRKSLTAQVLYDDLVATLSMEATAYSMVTNYLRAARIIPRDATAFSAATSPHIDESDEAILRALEELPFSSVRKLSCTAHLPKTTLHRTFSKKLGFTARHLRSVPHIVSDDQKAKLVQCSKSLLTKLLAQQTRDWHDSVTLDEAWFYYITDHEFIWLLPDGKVPDRERVTIQSTEMMHTIVWRTAEFAGVAALESGCKFTAGYYVSEVLTPLSEQ